ncbi:uncharacterized protein LOC142237090 [Haematobia irritans]|uniref:uncharacterized protein LOC142237090 n=1 Tax=Haematobia irritans TaxID=7368 RepID=UPI003F50723A
MDLHRLRIKSLDDDDTLSNYSCNLRNSQSCPLNSDSELSGSISVRDLVRRYDCNWKSEESTNSNSIFTTPTSRQSHSTLMDRTSQTQCHLRRTSSSSTNLLDTPLRGCFHKQQKYHHHQQNHVTVGCCKNCTACMCCQNRSRKSSAAIKAFQSNESIGNPNVDNTVVLSGSARNSAIQKSVEFKDDFGTVFRPTPPPTACSSSDSQSLNVRTVMAKNHLPSSDSLEEANCHSIETSYQSKTTIAKTASGVRIIIDIFFDPEQCVNTNDVVGGRVETDIPHSRILDEFQQQINATTAAATRDSSMSASATINN